MLIPFDARSGTSGLFAYFNKDDWEVVYNAFDLLVSEPSVYFKVNLFTIKLLLDSVLSNKIIPNHLASLW